METKDKLGEVTRTPLGGLKKICEEYSLASILGGKLEKFHTLVNTKYEILKKEKQNNNDRAMFPKGTMEDLIKEIEGQREEELLSER